MSFTMSNIDQLDLPKYLHRELTDYELYLEYGLYYQVAKKILYRTYLRTILSERQNHKCCYCGRQVTDIVNSRTKSTLEHVIPESKGGATDLWNCVIACSKCNNKRQCDYIAEEEYVVLSRSNEHQFVRPYGAEADSGLDDYGSPF